MSRSLIAVLTVAGKAEMATLDNDRGWRFESSHTYGCIPFAREGDDEAAQILSRGVGGNASVPVHCYFMKFVS